MLKALELTGFKSFAEKTRFEFHAGVTVVVGPNGSGKSNVVDAIKWVLGSQSAKSLRGSEMTDVIFNGSASRGALHTAEVTLLLDNSKETYQSESQFGGKVNEVAITRRVYRSGEGEYLINGNACRLRDIREMLAGTGIGTEAYSIIEQGKVDALLQASPQDRRSLFEEAAGISRFRTKRQEAAKRLSRVEQNLLRLSDIVDEVESQLRSVRMQAGKAQRFREGTRRLKLLRTQIGIADWTQLSGRLQSVAGELGRFQEEHRDQREAIAAAEREIPKIDAALLASQASYENLEQRLAKLRENAVASEATAAGLLARQHDLESNREALQQQWHRTYRADEKGVPSSVSILERLEAAKSEYDDATRQHAANAEKEHQLTAAVTRGESQLEELRRRHADTERRAALLEQTLLLLQEQQATSQNRRLQIDAERGSHDEELRQLALEHQAAQEEGKQASKQCNESADELKTAQEQLGQNQSRLRSLRKESQQVEGELSSCRHRRELIEELDREEDQTSESTRRLLRKVGITSPKESDPPLVVGDLLHVDLDTASVIEAALGAIAEYYVVPQTEALLQSDVSLPPGAKLLRLDWNLPANAIDRVDLGGQPGVWGRADQFVDSLPEFAPLVRRLLGRTWIVDTLPTAVRLALAEGHGLHFVTADGDLLSADGTLVAGGKPAARGAGSRRNQIEQLRQKGEQLSPRAQKLQEELFRLESNVQNEESRVGEILQRHRLALEGRSDARQKIALLESRQTPMTERQAMAVQETKGLAQELDLLEKDYLKQTQSLAELTQQQEQLAAACGKIESQLATVRNEREARRKATGEQEIAVAKLENQIEVLAATSFGNQASQRQVEVRREFATQMEMTRHRIAEIERERLTCGDALSAIVADRDRLFPQRRHEGTNRADLQERREAFGHQLSRSRQQIDETQARKAKLELSAARIEHQRQTLADRLQDDYEIDLPAVAASAPPQPTGIDRKQVEREIEQLREGLHRIGSVNVDSLEELDAIESRFESISAQYNDLSQAKTSLEQLMARLNTESRQLFLTTVDTVRGHFQELFRRLFGGGDADIVLEDYDSDDALDCGIEIRACPPGKETRTISLLSGGEKTMTCVALLLAMFRSKPSPFCILDEVDAALDEANIGRFTSVLSDFLSSTQFIVITHSKKTMTGADTLYGVTMQESGVSKQVSVRFDDVTEDGFIKPSAWKNSSGEPPLARAA